MICLLSHPKFSKGSELFASWIAVGPTPPTILSSLKCVAERQNASPNTVENFIHGPSGSTRFQLIAVILRPQWRLTSNGERRRRSPIKHIGGTLRVMPTERKVSRRAANSFFTGFSADFSKRLLADADFEKDFVFDFFL